MVVVFTFLSALAYTQRALKYCACAQNVSDVIHRLHILGCWLTPRRGVRSSQVLCLCTECARCLSWVSHLMMLAYTQTRSEYLSGGAPEHRMSHMVFKGFTVGMLAYYTPTRGEELSSTAPAHRMYQMSFRFPILGCWPRATGGVESSTVPRLRMECVRCHSQASHAPDASIRG